MSLVEELKGIADVVRKMGNMELYRQITQLETQVLDLTRATRRLEHENDELRTKLTFRGELTFRNSVYYHGDDPVPYCPRCWEAERKAVHLRGPNSVLAGTRFDCVECKNLFITERREPDPTPQPPRRRSPWS